MTQPPQEPLDIFGPASAPEGYVRMGWACPRDPSRRCVGCDKDGFSIPSHCGQGDPAYRSLAWIEWASIAAVMPQGG